MLKMKRTLAAAAMLFAACQGVSADVLSKTPAEALMAFKVSNLDQTNTKFAKFAADLGAAQFVPELNDPLTALLTRGNMTKGIDRKGEAAIAFLPPAEGTELGDEANMLILLPVTSTKEFLSNFQNTTEVDGFTQVTMPNGDTSLVADWGQYAALSQNAALLKAPAATLKLSGVSASEAAKQDFILFANFEKISPSVLAELDKGLQKAIEEIDKGGEGDDAKKLPDKYKPLAKVGVTQLMNVAKTFFNESKGGVVGMTFTPAGLNFSAIGDFKEGSYLGKLASSIKGTSQPLTTGLPTVKYLAFGGVSTESPAIAKSVDDTIAPIADELAKIDGLSEASQLTATFRSALKASKGSVVGMPAPKAIGTEAVIQQISITRGGGQDWQKVMDQGGTLAKTFLADLEVPEGEPKPSITITPKAKTIDGVAFDKWTVDQGLKQDDPAAQEALAAMQMMYGQEGLTYTFASIGDDFVLGSSVSDENLSTFVKAFKANDASVAALPQVKAVSDELPKARVYEAYIQLDEILNVSMNVVGQMQGRQMQMALPPDMAPLGLSLGAEGSALRIDAHLPQTTLRDLVAAGMQAYMQMQQGGGGGGGAGM
jgi:hypothetical protein